MAEFDFITGADKKLKDANSAQSSVKTPPMIPSKQQSSRSTGITIGAPRVPEAVNNALEKLTETKQEIANNQVERTDKLISVLSTKMKEVKQANANIDEALSNPFTPILEIFDSDYNVQKQARKIQTSQQEIQQEQALVQLQEQKDTLELANVAAPIEAYKSLMEFQKSGLELSTAHANALIQSQEARNKLGEAYFAKLTPQEILSRHKAQDYDDLFTREQAEKYIQDQQTVVLDLESKKMANQAGRLDLAAKFEERALSTLPTPNLRYAISQAREQKSAVVQVAPDFSIPMYKAEALMETRESEAQKRVEEQASRYTKLAQNDAVISSINTNVAALSSLHNGGAQANESLKNFNMLNVNSKTYAEIPFGTIHPSIRADVASFYKAMSDINETKNPTIVQMKSLRQQAEALNKKVLEQQEIAKKSYSKISHPAIEEYFQNGGRIRSDQNAQALISENLVSLPDLGGDEELAAAFQQIQTNVAQLESNGALNLKDLSPEEASNLVVQTIVNKAVNKDKLPDKVRKAALRTDANGNDAKTTYVNNKIGKIFLSSIATLTEKFPELKDLLFDSEGRMTDKWSVLNPKTNQRTMDLQKLAFNLTVESERLRQKDPANAPPRNYYNTLLTEEINKVIKANKDSWDAPMNPERSALMALIFNNPPSQIVDTTIQNSYAQWAVMGLDEAKDQIEKERVEKFLPSHTPFSTY